MPTIPGSKSGTRPYLELDWSIKSQDIANNRSTLTLKLYLKVDYSIGYNARYTGVLQGSSFTANAGYLSKPGRYLLTQREITVGHSSDGTKTVNFSASYNISINWSNTYYSSISLSGTGTLTPIPRGSTLSAFGFASSLQVGTKVNINYTVARHSSSYRHQIQLRDGSVTVATWDNVSSNGSTSVELSGTQVNTLLGRMSTVTSKSFTLRVATRSRVNGGWIGNAVTRNATVSVNDNVKPVINSTSATPIGNSWAVGKGFYVQGQTGVQAEFSSTSRGGAGTRSRSISIGSLSSGGSAVGNVFRHSQSSVNSTGNIKITYKITDTRGRSASAERTINFRAYTPPKITSFTVGRSSPTSSTTTVKSKGSIHGMGGQNTGTMTVKQQGVTDNVRTQSLNNTTPSFNDSFNRTVATSASADFTIKVTDLLGNSATATSTVGTAFMEFSIRKGKGVGIGKVHEKGVLDVDGEAHFKGDLFVNGVSASSTTRLADVATNITDSVGFWTTLPQGKYFVGPDTIPNQPSAYGIIDHTGMRGEFNTIWYRQASGAIWRKSGNHNFNNDWILIDRPETGSNISGEWIKFNDGTMIQTSRRSREVTFNSGNKLGSLYFSTAVRVPFPEQFIDVPKAVVSIERGNAGGLLLYSPMYGPTATESPQIRVYSPNTTAATIYVICVAIGRWK